MAKTRGTIRVTGELIEWVDERGVVEFRFNIDEINPNLVQSVLIYGAKQIISDGGAVGRDAPLIERIAKMDKRAASLRAGTWAFRDGHGTPRPESDSATMYAALVAVAAFADNEDARAIWKAMRPAERVAVFRDNPEAVAHAEANAARPTVDTDALLSKLRAAA